MSLFVLDRAALTTGLFSACVLFAMPSNASGVRMLAGGLHRISSVSATLKGYQRRRLASPLAAEPYITASPKVAQPVYYPP